MFEALKEEAATAAIPAIVLSNLGQERDVQRSIECGAHAHLIKANLSPQELVNRVEDILSPNGQ